MNTFALVTSQVSGALTLLLLADLLPCPESRRLGIGLLAMVAWCFLLALLVSLVESLQAAVERGPKRHTIAINTGSNTGIRKENESK